MKSLTFALAASVLAGCAANPLIGWQRPDESKKGDKNETRMIAANALAISLRTALETKQSEQVNVQVGLNNALLGLGVVTMGLALGKANPDAIAGAALLGGATYLFGTQNTSKPRLVIYQEGISAVNCALRAVAPLNLGPAGEAPITEGAAALPSALNKLQSAIGRVENLQSTAPANRRTDVEVALANSNAVLAAGTKTATDANDLLGKIDQAGGALSGTVEKIAEQVNKFASETVPTSSAVVQSIASLATISASFAPGVKLKNLAPVAQGGPVAVAQGKPAFPLAMPQPLADALRELDQATTAVDIVQQPLAAKLAAVAVAKAPGSLADCGVSDSVLSLVVDVDILSFKGKADETQFVSVSGGVKPYVGRLRESPATGVVVKSPLPGDSNVEVTVAKSVEKGSFHLVIMDAADLRKSKTVAIEIGQPGATDAPVPKAPAAKAGAAGKADQPGAKPATFAERFAATVASVKALALKGDQGRFAVGDSPKNTYVVRSVDDAKATGVVVHLDCNFGGRERGDSSQSVVIAMIAKARSLGLTADPSLEVVRQLGLQVEGKNCLRAE